ncbi:MAG: TIGR03943 family putative permease subunit [Bacillota bacterium]
MKRGNVNEWIWFLILGGFTYYLYDLMASGNINLFIHPKMIKYVVLSMVVFTVMTILQVKRLFTNRNSGKIRYGYILFLIPLILGFAVTPQPLNADVASKKGITIINENEETVPQKEPLIQIETDGVIRFNDADYSYILGELMGNLEQYKGKQIEITGFVFKEDHFEKNQFVSARLMMTCCAADAQVVGLMCEWNGAGTLEKEKWVKVTGIIDTFQYMDPYLQQEETIPVIRAQRVELISPPAIQYVYP